MIGFEKRARASISAMGSNSRACTYYKQYKSQISNVRISAMEAATDTKQNAIGSSRAVL